MKACVLCPGPSLSGRIGQPIRERYDLVVGVNRAAEVFECDYWVALDTRTFGMTRVVGRPMIVSSAVHYRRMCAEWPEARTFEHLDTATLASRKLPHSWSTKGLLTALVVAHSKGANTIDCYGVDWKGVRDFDGQTFPGQKRTTKRWDREARQFAKLKEALLSLNTTVRRIAAEEDVPQASLLPSHPV